MVQTLSPSYSFVKFCLHCKILHSNFQNWNADVESISYTYQKPEDSLVMQITIGDFKVRFRDEQLKIITRVVQTLQVEQNVIQTSQDGKRIANLATFIFKCYLDDIAQYRKEQESKSEGQRTDEIAFLMQPSEKLLYALLSQFVAKPMHQPDEFYFIAKQADVELSAHLQLLNFDDMSFEQCYFVDYVPDLLLKMLFQCVL